MAQSVKLLSFINDCLAPFKSAVERNGISEVGIEAASDVGLPYSFYTRVPFDVAQEYASMINDLVIADNDAKGWIGAWAEMLDVVMKTKGAIQAAVGSDSAESMWSRLCRITGELSQSQQILRKFTASLSKSHMDKAAAKVLNRASPSGILKRISAPIETPTMKLWNYRMNKLMSDRTKTVTLTEAANALGSDDIKADITTDNACTVLEITPKAVSSNTDVVTAVTEAVSFDSGFEAYAAALTHAFLNLHLIIEETSLKYKDFILSASGVNWLLQCLIVQFVNKWITATHEVRYDPAMAADFAKVKAHFLAQLGGTDSTLDGKFNDTLAVFEAAMTTNRLINAPVELIFAITSVNAARTKHHVLADRNGLSGMLAKVAASVGELPKFRCESKEADDVETWHPVGADAQNITKREAVARRVSELYLGIHRIDDRIGLKGLYPDARLHPIIYADYGVAFRPTLLKPLASISMRTNLNQAVAGMAALATARNALTSMTTAGVLLPITYLTGTHTAIPTLELVAKVAMQNRMAFSDRFHWISQDFGTVQPAIDALEFLSSFYGPPVSASLRDAYLSGKSDCDQLIHVCHGYFYATMSSFRNPWHLRHVDMISNQPYREWCIHRAADVSVDAETLAKALGGSVSKTTVKSLGLLKQKIVPIGKSLNLSSADFNEMAEHDPVLQNPESLSAIEDALHDLEEAPSDEPDPSDQPEE
jgi:hypothetical protein